MADNVTTNPGSGGATFATDDIGGIQYPRFKINYGVDGSATDVSASNPLPITYDESTTVSANNTTSTNLGISAVFTGVSDDIKDFSGVVVTVFSSHASATNGLALQQSMDNTNWDLADTYTVAAATALTIQLPPQGRYFRIVYTNGATATTSLRITTYLRRRASIQNSQRPADAMTNENDFSQEMAFNMLFNGTTWDRFRGDTTSGLDVDVTRISGQNLQFTNGVVAAGVLRVTLASDGTGQVAVFARASGGYTPHSALSAASINATSVKATAGTVGYIIATNTNAAVRYLKLYNKGSAPAPATDNALLIGRFAIPGSTTGGGVVIPIPPQGINCSTGIAYAIVTGSSDTDATAVAAGEIMINMGYA